MGLININELTPDEIREMLSCIDGITPTTAKKIGDFIEKNGALADKDALERLLKEVGVSRRYIKPILKKAIDVLPRPQAPDDGELNEPVDPLDLFNPFDDGAFDVPVDDNGDGSEPITPGEFATFKPPKKNNRPLVFVPGIFASELFVERLRIVGNKEVKFRGKTFTVPDVRRVTERIWPPIGVDGIETSLKELVAELQNDITRNNIKVGSSFTYNPYSVLLLELEKSGYSERIGNLFIHNYNWALSDKENAEKLQKSIEKTYLPAYNKRFPTSKTKKVDVICHSNGGLITRGAIVLNKAKINKTVYIAVPHFGSPQAYFYLKPQVSLLGGRVKSFALEVGFNILKALFVNLDRTITRVRNSKVKEFNVKEYDNVEQALTNLAAVAGAMYDLVPDKFYLDNVPMVLDDAKFFSSPKGIKGVEETYFNTKNPWTFKGDIAKRVKVSLDFKHSLGSKIPGKHLNLYGDLVETFDRITVKGRSRDEIYIQEASTQGGDGTVPTYSGSGGIAKFGNQKNSDVIRDPDKGTSEKHNGLPNHIKTILKLRKYLEL